MSRPEIVSRCGSCGTVVDRARRSTPAIGRPITKCPKCGAWVERSSFNEWDLFSPPEKMRHVGEKGALLVGLGIAPALLYAVAALVRRGAYDPLVLAALVGVGLLLAIGGLSARVGRDIRRSRSRMADPIYRAQLVEFGMTARHASGSAQKEPS